MDLEKEKTEKRNQQLEVFKESGMLLSLHSNFVVALLPTFKDQMCAYSMMQITLKRILRSLSGKKIHCMIMTHTFKWTVLRKYLIISKAIAS